MQEDWRSCQLWLPGPQAPRTTGDKIELDELQRKLAPVLKDGMATAGDAAKQSRPRLHRVLPQARSVDVLFFDFPPASALPQFCDVL